MIASEPSVADPVTPPSTPVETIEYLTHEGEQVYCVRHHARGVRWASMLMCGPIGAERERAYRTLVELARILAAAGVEVLRFDYRGIGESTGCFAGLCLTDWKRDVSLCLTHLRASAPNVPLVLWGVRAGSILAAEAFAEGHADAMLLCAPPLSGESLLQEVLRRVLVAEMLARPSAPRASREEILSRLERGELANIDGYLWSGSLWRDAQRHSLQLPVTDEIRSWGVIDFRGQPHTVLHSGTNDRRKTVAVERFWLPSPLLVPSSTELYDVTLTWLRSIAAQETGS